MKLKLIPLLAVLAVAVAGVSYAAIPASNGTITACKDNKGALKVIDAEAGQSCPGNAQALTWNQQGPAGADGISGWQVVEQTGAFSADDAKGFVTVCPEGKRPLGGGAVAIVQAGSAYLNAVVVASYQAGAFEAEGWFVRMRELTPSTTAWTIKSSVVCANVG